MRSWKECGVYTSKKRLVKRSLRVEELVKDDDGGSFVRTFFFDPSPPFSLAKRYVVLGG